MSYYGEIGTFTPDNLIAGEKIPIIVQSVTVASGQGVLKRGSVIGIITASGKGKLAAKTATDGSQAAKYILADNVDATSADVVALCYASGEFNREALIFAADNTDDDHQDSLRQYGIYLRSNMKY